MPNADDSDDDLSDLEQEAIAWLVRRGNTSGWSETDEAEFQRWINASTIHAEAFGDAQATMQEMGAPSVFKPSEVERMGKIARYEQPSSSKALPWFTSLAAAAVIVILAAVFWPASIQTYETAIGERREIALPDGTLVELDAKTRIEYQASQAGRIVTLASGAAVFKVAPEETPFAVIAGDCSIRDIGTTFSVKRRGVLDGIATSRQAVEIAVEEGIVEVQSIGRDKGSPVRLVQGQQTVYSGADETPGVLELPQGAFASWRESRLRYRERPLTQVLSDLQRHYEGRIILLDASLGSLKVTGTLRSDNIQDTIELLSDILPIRISEFTDQRVVIERS